MACYNMMIPHIVSDLPADQAAAVSIQIPSARDASTARRDGLGVHAGLVRPGAVRNDPAHAVLSP